MINTLYYFAVTLRDVLYIDKISKIFHPDRIGFCKSLSPFSRAFVQNRFLPRWHSLIFYSKLLGAFLCRRYSAAFSPTNKMYFICSKEKDKFILFFKSTWCKIASTESSWISSSPQTAAMTLAFSFVFILLLWVRLF